MKTLRAVVPIAIAVVLLALVLRRVGGGELLANIRSADARLVLLAAVAATLTYVPKVHNWRQLLRAEGYTVGYLALARLHFIGLFFNNMLPGNVGGDVVRSLEVGRRIANPATALASVFVERFVGLVVLVLLAGVSFMVHFQALDSPPLMLALVVTAVGIAVLGWLVFDPAFSGFVERMLPAALHPYLVKARKVQAAVLRYRARPRLLVQCVFASLQFNAIAIVYTYLAISAFHRPMDLFGTALIVPLVMVVAMLPLSFNGVGLQEWAAVLLFPAIGVPAAAALSGMLLVRVLTLLKSLIGGAMYLHLKAQHASSGAIRAAGQAKGNLAGSEPRE